MPKNLGAPTARNVGLAQSFGDHAIMMDDDVVPSSQLVAAYVGAIARYPDAVGYVGLTKLPSSPSSYLQRALLAC